MRHRVAHRKLGRVTEHRIAMLRNQADRAAPPRAHRDHRAEGEGAAAVRRADHHDRQARRSPAGDAQRQAAERAPPGACATSRTATSSTKLFDTIAPRFEARPGGYTRLLRLGYRRGDSAEVAQIELVGSEFDPRAKRKRQARPKAKPKKAVGGRLRAAAERLRGSKAARKTTATLRRNRRRRRPPNGRRKRRARPTSQTDITARDTTSSAS